MKPLTRIAIVVGETSGDILGAGLMEALKKRYPACEFEGIGGDKMCALGFDSLFPMERLAVMGFIDPLKRLPELLSIRNALKKRYVANPPDVFIGIDAPDFNLTLEGVLKDNNIPVVHYVSPSVWAWRRGRVRKIARSVDLMLTLFPFEAKFYQENNVDVQCVGHLLADALPLAPDTLAARDKIGLEQQKQTIALLPGSRQGEVQRLCKPFVEAANLLFTKNKSSQFVIPAANEQRLAQIQTVVRGYPQLPIKILLGQSHDVMTAADAILIASGTATLEAALLKKPMVIAYKMAGFSYWLLRKLVKSRYIGLPNLLAEREMVPELLQHDVTAESLVAAIQPFLSDPQAAQRLENDFMQIHKSLRLNANESAADAIVAMLEKKND